MFFDMMMPPMPMMQQQAPHHHHHEQKGMLPPLPFPMLAMPDFGEMVGIELESAAQFAEGFINEFSDKNGLHALKDCVSSFHSVEGELKTIVDDFKTLNPVKMFDGAKLLMSLLTDLPGDLKACETIQGDVTKITAWGQNVINHPTAIMANVMTNMGDIMSEIPKVNTELSNGNYTLAGDDTAVVVVDVFGTVNTTFKAEPNMDLLFNL